MKRTFRFVQPGGMVTCEVPEFGNVLLPVVQGIFKHASPDALSEVLTDPDAARKYTLEALRVAPWPVLRLFPRPWLRTCLCKASLPERHLRALEFMLS